MSRDQYTEEELSRMALNRQADAMEDLVKLLRVYLKFAVGTGVKAMKAMGNDLPPEMAEIVADMEALDL